MSLKKIALISEHASPLAVAGGIDSGGQNIYVYNVAKELAKKGYSVDVFTRRDSDDLPEIVALSPFLRVIHVPAGPAEFVPKENMLQYMDDFSDYMIRFCQDQRGYDIVHANFFMSGIPAMALKKNFNMPFVVTFHALGRVRRQFQKDADGFPDERFRIEEDVIREAEGIIAECPQDRDDLIRLYGADRSKIRIIPCGFDPLELWPVNKVQAKKILGFNEKEHLILHLGRLVKRKGIENVIRGFAWFKKNFNTPCKLLIAGGSHKNPDPAREPEIARLKAIAAQEKVAEEVVFVGQVSRRELKYFYSASDMFISTPWYEPFGITLIEAMACGVPAIGSKVGGIKYTVREGKTGLLVQPEEPKALGKRISQMYQRPLRLGMFALGAYERAHSFFTWSKVTARLEAFYKHCAKLQQPQPALQFTRVRSRKRLLNILRNLSNHDYTLKSQ